MSLQLFHLLFVTVTIGSFRCIFSCGKHGTNSGFVRGTMRTTTGSTVKSFIARGAEQDSKMFLTCLVSSSGLLWSIESSLSTLSFDVLRSMVDQWTLTLQGKHSLGLSRLADFLLSIQNYKLQTEFYKTSHQCCPSFSCIPVRFRSAPRDVMYLLNAVALSMQRHISCKVRTVSVGKKVLDDDNQSAPFRRYVRSG
jgi:hypothetical protein